jgi:dihydrofolate reductase/thymidylate synthase
MGRKTWESLPVKYRPLPNRINVILTRGTIAINDENGMIEVYSDLEVALTTLSANPKVNEIFVIGGAQVYEHALKNYSEWCKLVIMTRIGKVFEADTFMPKIASDEDGGIFTKIHISKTYQHADITYDYCFMGNKKLLEKRPDLIPSRLLDKYPAHPEMQYLSIIKDIIETGSKKDDRTGVGIIGKFGYQMRFDLAESFPILTTKDVFWRGVAEELIWFVKGDTNAKHLSDKKIKIWDGNASREFLDKIGLKEREEWDLGPVYGF